MPSKNKEQQRLFQMVVAYKKGEMKNASDTVKKIAKSISLKDAEDMASAIVGETTTSAATASYEVPMGTVMRKLKEFFSAQNQAALLEDYECLSDDDPRNPLRNKTDKELEKAIETLTQYTSPEAVPAPRPKLPSLWDIPYNPNDGLQDLTYDIPPSPEKRAINTKFMVGDKKNPIKAGEYLLWRAKQNAKTFDDSRVPMAIFGRNAFQLQGAKTPQSQLAFEGYKIPIIQTKGSIKDVKIPKSLMETFGLIGITNGKKHFVYDTKDKKFYLP